MSSNFKCLSTHFRIIKKVLIDHNVLVKPEGGEVKTLRDVLMSVFSLTSTRNEYHATATVIWNSQEDIL